MTMNSDYPDYEIINVAMPDIRCQCGGRIKIYDTGILGRWRYESCCFDCSERDPDGYASRQAAADGAVEYFSAQNRVCA
jgi:hypothetical protein